MAALAENLDAMGFYPTTHGVFGVMADKDLAPILARIGPMIDRWYFTDLPTARAAKAADLLASWQAQNTRTDASGSVYAGPMEALQRSHRAARTPLIESWSSDRSSPWVACSSTEHPGCKPNTCSPGG